MKPDGSDHLLISLISLISDNLSTDDDDDDDVDDNVDDAAPSVTNRHRR